MTYANYAYIDSRHDELCRCQGCRYEPDTYSACGQVDPYGLVLRVEWEEYDQIAHAEVLKPNLFASDFTDADAERWYQETLPVARRIDGKRFANSEQLVDYLMSIGLDRSDFA